MINKLRAAFTRAKVNHPRKLIYGPPNAAAAMLIPFDGGITLAVTSFMSITFAGFIVSAAADEEVPDPVPLLTIDLDDHKKRAVIEHLGQKYQGTVAQEKAYDAMEFEIRKIQRKFSNASNAHRRKLNKKAQKIADQQQWIIDGLKQVTDDTPSEEQVEFSIQRGRTTRKTKKYGN